MSRVLAAFLLVGLAGCSLFATETDYEVVAISGQTIMAADSLFWNATRRDDGRLVLRYDVDPEVARARDVDVAADVDGLLITIRETDRGMIVLENVWQGRPGGYGRNVGRARLEIQRADSIVAGRLRYVRPFTTADQPTAYAFWIRRPE